MSEKLKKKSPRIGVLAVQGKLLHDLGLFAPIKNLIEKGLPTFGTCAGLILLAEKLSNDSRTYFGTLPATVERNAYGRQLGSFHAEENFEGIGKVPMTFIRAPLIQKVGEGVQVLSSCKRDPSGIWRVTDIYKISKAVLTLLKAP